MELIYLTKNHLIGPTTNTPDKFDALTQDKVYSSDPLSSPTSLLIQACPLVNMSTVSQMKHYFQLIPHNRSPHQLAVQDRITGDLLMNMPDFC